jgi:hypothetical protein
MTTPVYGDDDQYGNAISGTKTMRKH